MAAGNRPALDGGQRPDRDPRGASPSPITTQYCVHCNTGQVTSFQICAAPDGRALPRQGRAARLSRSGMPLLPLETDARSQRRANFPVRQGARPENLSGMKIPSRPGKRASGNFLLGAVHAAACGFHTGIRREYADDPVDPAGSMTRCPGCNSPDLRQHSAHRADLINQREATRDQYVVIVPGFTVRVRVTNRKAHLARIAGQQGADRRRPPTP